jgi:hypothetical protein
MHKPGTPWPVATRVSFIVVFEELRCLHSALAYTTPLKYALQRLPQAQISRVS